MRDRIDAQSMEAQFLDARFAELGAQLERGVAGQPPAWVRTGSRKIRQARRRRTAMVLVTAMAVAGVGVGVGSLAPGSGDRRPGIVGPAATGTPRGSGPSSAPSSGSASSAERVSTASGWTFVVDVERDVMTVSDAHGTIVRTVLISAGSPDHPTRPGVYTVTAKKPAMTLDAKSAGLATGSADTYAVPVKWVVLLGGNGPMLLEAPWLEASLGKANTTHGEIGIGPVEAQWVYGSLAVGDRIQVR